MSKVIIEAGNNNWRLGLRELFDYRDLFFVLAYRDFRVRYAQTLLGFAWAIIQPLFTLLIFIVVFGKALSIETGDIPYPLFVVSGMAGWTFFSFVLNNSGNSVINSQEMIKKIYFPRLIIPFSKALVGLIDLMIGVLLVMILVVYYGYQPSINIAFFPIAVILGVIASLGIGIWFSALSIRYRDIQHLIPFMVQLGLYVTPIAYPSSLVTSQLSGFYSCLYYLNPMAGIVDVFRWCILGIELSQYAYISLIVAIVIFVSGIFYFKRVERVMADLL
jgi:lipopolysaccharide transport system permease protein